MTGVRREESLQKDLRLCREEKAYDPTKRWMTVSENKRRKGSQ